MATRAERQRKAAGRERRQKDGGGSNAIDYDARKQEQREDTITLAGETYYRRLKDYEVSMDSQELADDQDVLNRQIEKLSESLDDIDPTTDEYIEVRKSIRDKLREATDKSYEIVALLLETEGGDRPPLAFLKENADVEWITEMVRSLLGGGEPLDGPTDDPES